MTWSPPLYGVPLIPVSPHPGAFGARRKHDVHTGVDLYTNEGAKVFAVEKGIVVAIEHFTGEWDSSPWWNNTDCVLIEGRSGVVCYGEVAPVVKVGVAVNAGDYIAKVVRVLKEEKRPDIPGHRPSMLHFELYVHDVRKPSFTLGPEVLDPTPLLREAMMEFSKEIQEHFIDLACQLSPENLSCDGEASRADINRRYAAIKKQWHALEVQVGRPVTEEEVWSWGAAKP